MERGGTRSICKGVGEVVGRSPAVSRTYDVFLSHNSKNKQFVLTLAKTLKLQGLAVWLDEWELIPGRPWQHSLEEIIKQTKAVAILVGDEGFGPWELMEARATLVQCVERGIPVIPVLLPRTNATVELPVFLSAFTWVDLRDGLTEAGVGRLVWGITGHKPLTEANGIDPLPDVTSAHRPHVSQISTRNIPSTLKSEKDPNALLAESRRIQLEDNSLFLKKRLSSDLRLTQQIASIEERLFGHYLGLMATNCSLYEAVSHFHKLEAYVSKLCPSPLKETFTPYEAFVLLAAIYLKDLGLSRCFSDIRNYPLDDHHLIGYELFLDVFAEFNLDKEMALTIAPLIRAHRIIPLSDLSMETAYGDETIRSRLLCALLRLGDFLDFPSGKMSMTALNVGAIIKYAAVTGIQIDQPVWRIRISGSASTLQESEFLLTLWFNLQSVLDSVRETLEKYNLHYKVIEVDSNALRPYFSSRNFAKELQKQMIDPSLGVLTETEFYRYVARTPLLNSKIIDLEFGSSLSFKCESNQETGSFKFRGAISIAANATDEEKQRGVFLASSGNFAVAMITAAKIFGLRITHVLVPRFANRNKLKFIRQYSGAEILFFEEEEKETLIDEVAAGSGSLLITATDQRAQRGYETLVSEIYQKGDFDALLIPIGEGALMSACATASKRLRPYVRLVGCEPASRNDAYVSFNRGELSPGASDKTIADGLVANLSQSTFTTIVENVDDILTVEEDQIERANEMLLDKVGLDVEPSAAVTLAAIMKHRRRFYNKRLCLLLTGQNHKEIQPSRFLALA